MNSLDDISRDAAVLAFLLASLPAKVVAEFMDGHPRYAQAFERMRGWDDGGFANRPEVPEVGQIRWLTWKNFPSRAKIGRLRNLRGDGNALSARVSRGPVSVVVPAATPDSVRAALLSIAATVHGSAEYSGTYYVEDLPALVDEFTEREDPRHSEMMAKLDALAESLGVMEGTA